SQVQQKVASLWRMGQDGSRKPDSGKRTKDRMMGWGRRMLAALLGARLLAGPARAAQAPAPAVQSQGEPHPAIWLLADADTRIYLFGTVHVLHPDLRWRSTTFNRIAGEAQELVLELSDTEMSPDNTAAFAAMRMAKSVPVLQRVSPNRRAGLARMMRELQIPAGSLDNLETWAVAVLLGVGQMAHEYAGGDTSAQQAAEQAAGVEETLTREFHANGRPISGVETASDQIGAFRGMPRNVQQEMLDETV